jgi:hypothetical protein
MPCGECVHANLLHQRPAFHQCTSSAAANDIDIDNSEHRNSNNSNSNNNNSNNDAIVYASFDVETAEPFSWFLPQHFALPLLLSQTQQSHNEQHNNNNVDMSNVIWILNQRGSADQWATNVLHWYSVTRRLLHTFNVTYHDDEQQDYDDNYDDSPPDDDWNETNAALAMAAAAAARGSIAMDENTNRHWYTALEHSYRRAYNRTAHERRYAALVDIYRRHAAKVTDFVESLSSYHADNDAYPDNNNNVPRLVHVSVDDQQTGQHLAEMLGLPTAAAEACWSFDADALDNDWLDFTLPL